MFKQLPKLNNLLKSYFGFEQFRGQQEEIIKSILEGNDTFVIMPTGGGKSLCYQLPALASEGTAIVISPLIALMKNQVDLIRSYSNEENIAHFLNSSLTKAQIRQVKDDITEGKTKILYVAPESLVKEENLEFLRSITISFVAVDEAHCISEWGHDFRPEYRKIRKMIDSIEGGIAVMALTATATPKVQADIVKTLNMQKPNVFKDSFLRHNLFYEIRPKVSKDAAEKDIIRFIKKEKGKSGIIYCLSRKSTEELAERLSTNGIRAVAYHAGLDAKTRTETQDKFLMEEYDVIVATIAFGMGIDKPDVRFVIHYDVPKSLENYYQETGRAGRDGLEGQCITYFSPKDIDKMEKLLRDKPVAEREIGLQHLGEMEAYAVTGECRKRFVLHYFGEEMDMSLCYNMCDNCRTPKPKTESSQELKWLLEAVEKTNEQLTLPNIINILIGKPTKDVLAYGYDKLNVFGKGKDKDALFWESIGRKAILDDLLYKEIEQYGILKLTEKSHAFKKNPHSFPVILNQVFVSNEEDEDHSGAGNSQALDTVLFDLLKSLRLTEAKKHKVMPWVIFMDPSLEEMSTLYPVNLEELSKISGISAGKASKFGKPFVDLISKYVEENDITRPSDFSDVKSVANKLNNKIKIIDLIDRRIPLKDIASSRQMSLNDLITELEQIVLSGTKVNIKYDLKENIDADIVEIIYDYFSEAKTDAVDVAYKALKDEDIEIQEIRLVRINYLSEMANG
jgi:ATP-dependent DNA helicase RecQ